MIIYDEICDEEYRRPTKALPMLQPQNKVEIV